MYLVISSDSVNCLCFSSTFELQLFSNVRPTLWSQFVASWLVCEPQGWTHKFCNFWLIFSKYFRNFFVHSKKSELYVQGMKKPAISVRFRSLKKLSAALRTNRWPKSFCGWEANNFQQIIFSKWCHSAKKESIGASFSIFLNWKTLKFVLIFWQISILILIFSWKTFHVLKHFRKPFPMLIQNRKLIPIMIQCQKYPILIHCWRIPYLNTISGHT